jgi:hypothetical protein
MKRITAVALFLTVILLHVAIMPPFLSQNASGLTGVAPIKLSPPQLNTVYSPPIQEIRTGQQVVITTAVAHNYDNVEALPLVVLIEVRNSDDITLQISWQSGRLQEGADSSMNVGVSWIPEDPGMYKLRTFAITDFENPQVLTEVYESEVTIQHGNAMRSIIILTDDKLLRLSGTTVEYEKELDRHYSEVLWDGNNFYLATLQKPGTYQDVDSVENKLLVLDRNFNEISSHHFGAPVYDFAAQDGIVYFLIETKLRLLDLSQEDPSFVKTNRSVSFEKHVHDIIAEGDHAYLLDNIAVPLYIHLVDLPSLEVHTREFPGVNAHLVAQDISAGKWYVLRSTSVMNGYFEDLLVFKAESGRLYEEPQRYGLVSLPRDSTHEPNLEDVYQISSILVDGEIVYALGYGFSLDGEGRELNLGIYSLEEGGKRLSLIGLNDTSDAESYRVTTNIVLVGNKVYVGGDDGLYIIDVSDLGNPFVSDIIEVEAPVRFIALV